MKLLLPSISTADRSGLTLDVREVVYDTDTDTIWYGDGTTAGGIEIPLGATLADGDYGDITVSSSGTVLTIDNNVVSLAKMATMATDSFLGRDTAGTGNVEVLSVATVKTLLSLTGTNSGDETSSTLGATINGAAAATPNDTDLVATVESSVVKKITWTNVKAFLKTYFDTLYNLYVHPNHTGEVTSTGDGATVLDKTAITGKTAVTAVSTDYVLISDTSDSGNLKKALVSDIELTANKDRTGGYAGLTSLKINFRNVADTITSFFTNTNTNVRTYTFQDRDGTIADDTDLSSNATNDRARANHTGTQLASTISDFSTAALTAAPAETTTTTGALINGATSKSTPVDADYVGLMDSAASNILKKLSWANIKATLGSYFDTLYVSRTAEPVCIQVACSDLTTVITAGTSKAYFCAPYAFSLTEVRASLLTAQTGGSKFTVDINVNGATILSTKITIDNNENTSVTAATPAVISSSSISDDRIITIDVDVVGTGSPVGLIVTLIGKRTV